MLPSKERIICLSPLSASVHAAIGTTLDQGGCHDSTRPLASDGTALPPTALTRSGTRARSSLSHRPGPVYHPAGCWRRHRCRHANGDRGTWQALGPTNSSDQSARRWRRPGGTLRSGSGAGRPYYTLFLALASAFVVLPQTQRNLSFNVNDFVPVGFVAEAPMAIAVSPTLPVSNVSELIALSKKQPGGLNAAVSFRGGMPHLTTELFASRSGAALTSVHYPGSAQSVSDVISGRVQVITEGLGGPVGSGQVKLLGIASHHRLATRPDLPTVAETLPGFAASGWYVLVAPRGTQAPLVQKLNEDVRTVL